MHLVSINTARVTPLFVNGSSGGPQTVMTGSRKQPVNDGDGVKINRLGLAGDEQADLTVHGGLDKAVYAYPIEHYSFWQQEGERIFKQIKPLAMGALGENLTTQGLLETALWVGDRLQIGEVLLEVTEPRAPCYKFAACMGYKSAVKQMLQSGFTGVYLRVIETGVISARQAIQLIPGVREVSIAQINGQRLRGRQRDLFL